MRRLAIGLVLLASTAHAHNKLVHQDMVDLAYEVMNAVRQYRELQICPVQKLATPCPLGGVPRQVATSEQWDRWLKDVSRAVSRLSGRANDLPAPRASCPSADDPAFASRPLSEVGWAPSVEYRTGGGCGVRDDWRPGGIFNYLGPFDPTGAILGYHAATVDDEDGDWHLWLRPTSVGGLGEVKKVASEVWQDGVAALVLPLVCAWDCIFNSCDKCSGHARDFARDSDPVQNLDGLIPGVGDIHGDTFIGQGHHINMEPSCSNEFDDHQGLLTEEAGPGGVLDVIEVGAMAMQDLGGLSLHYADSAGPGRYQITSGHDGHADTRERSEAEWQFSTSPHTAYTPVDNLAMYGWRAFRDDPNHPISKLGWPLHALGDASVPHHVTATFGWGHRPYEDAQERLWTRIRHQTGNASWDPLNAAEADQQLSQAIEILRSAYVWRQKIVQWRAARGGGVDLPMRDLVTELAQNTSQRAANDQATGWPFMSGRSLQYLADEGAAINGYANRADAISLVEPYFIDSIGAIVAFLVSASEVLS